MGRWLLSATLGTRAALWLAGVAPAVAQCETRGSRCICEDEGGTEWDLTELADEPPHTADGPAASAGEWEYSFKRGFKCTFERGILHVYFNFNRARYRR